jgi:hypothetical protein
LNQINERLKKASKQPTNRTFFQKKTSQMKEITHGLARSECYCVHVIGNFVNTHD